MERKIHTPNKERGSQVAELALALPLLCLIVFAIIDGADVVRAHILLNNAAREGARMGASLYCPTCATSAKVPATQNYVLQYVTSETNGLGIGPNGKDGWCSASQLSAGNITVNPNVSYTYSDPSNPSGTSAVCATQVAIDYPYTFCYVSKFTGGLSSTITLHTEATFYNLYPCS
jgi:Flp pilus assembly protein TadG